MKHTLHRIIFGALLCISTAASAHPGHNVSGFSAGLLHPFSGMDHLLAMFAVGLWAAQMGGRKIWLLPATFMSMLVAGAGFAVPSRACRCLSQASPARYWRWVY